jgi:hypothetical protein
MEVTLKDSLYKVTMLEYERGYGQRFMGEKFFTTEAEAKRFCDGYAFGDEDCFFRATYTKIR